MRFTPPLVPSSLLCVPSAPPQVDFFTSPAIKAMFQGWVQTLATRVNTINGRAYRDDPTIMAWVREEGGREGGGLGGHGLDASGPSLPRSAMTPHPLPHQRQPLDLPCPPLSSWPLVRPAEPAE